MISKLRNLFAAFAILFIMTGGLLAIPQVTHAQQDSLDELGDASGLATQSLEVTIANIIRIFLGTLGIIAVLIIIWGGFVWMTAGGDASKVESAKKILLNGIVGLTIIMLSFAITSFILGSILEAGSGGSGSGSGSDSGSDSCLGGCSGSSVTSFAVTDFSPEGEVVIRNIQVQITFSRSVDEDTVAGNVTITNDETGEEVDGTLSVTSNKITFVPDAACPEPNDDRYCFDENTAFTVEVGDDIESTSGSSLVCSDDSCTSSFTSGELVDTEDPEVELTYPDSGERISIDSSTLVQVTATDDSEVATADFYDDEEVLFDSVPAEGDDLSDVTIETTYSTEDLEAGTRYTLEVTATDIAGNTDTDSISILATAAHCFNDTEDEDEEGEDCGGEDCGSCDGSSCEEDSDCESGTCLEGTCVSYPEIESVSPDNGIEGTFVTISGDGFGSVEGTVYFDDGAGSTVEATIPSCGDGWSDDEVIVEVPEGAGDGPITIVTRNDYEETTDDDNGAIIDDFDVNTTVRPNLCDISPNEAEVNDAFAIEGTNFGDSQSDSVITFTAEDEDETEAGSYTSWSATDVAATVPSVTVNDYYDVSITVDGVESNTVSFGVEDTDDDSPIISAIDPEEGGIGQYVTISGSGFGTSVGSVWFEHPTLGAAQGSIEFPDACSESFWSASEIVIIVPEEFSNEDDVEAGDYELYIEKRSGGESDAVDFEVTEDDPTPGICAIDPDDGESGDTVTIYGDNFGSSTGSIEFYDGSSASVEDDDWSNDEIVTSVPSDAVTGPVFITNNEGEDSNSSNFEIGADDEEDEEATVDGGYSWYFGTGSIPETPGIVVECSDDDISAVPNERFTDEVCVDAVIRATFTELMDEDFLTSEYITVEECADSSCEDVSTFTMDAPTITSSSTATSFTIDHSGFSTETRYLVTVSSDVESEEGVQMDSDVTWEFLTDDSSADCEIERVIVSPSSELLEEQGETTEYEALPVADCQVLSGATYAWTWSLDTSSYASLTEGICDDTSLNDSCAVAEALAEGESVVNAIEDDSGIGDDADLEIDYRDPYVTSYYPNCNTACVNSGIGASFNIDMDSSIQDTGMVTMYECSNELCVGLTQVDVTAGCTSSECEEFVLTITESGWDAQLTADTYFRVIISGDVESSSGVALTDTNYGDDFSWVFSTKDDESLCTVDRLEVSPENYTAEAIGETVEYFVQPYGQQDECSSTGQQLSAYSYDYEWSVPIDDVDVAEWTEINSSLFDVDLDGIAPGCTESCLAGGSEVYTAICGDGDIETGEDCDDGNVTNGDGCSSECLAEGTNSCSFTCASSGDSCSDDEDCAETCEIADDSEEGVCSVSGDVCAIDADCTYADTCDAVGSGCCGDGVVDVDSSYAGEECDDSNITDGDGCSSSCINEGSAAAGATCGNGSVGHSDSVGGEDCDDGGTSSGDGCSAICLNEGSTALTSVAAECGDGVIDTPYETCDDWGVEDEDGCSSICLREGADGDYGDCGDNAVDQGAYGEGEDCDGTEGCSDECLWEGASTSYASPSVCGDGEAGTGEFESCEDPTYDATGGDGIIDPLQLVEIMTSAAEQVDTDSRLAETLIEVTYEDVSDSTALYLSCVAEVDSDCESDYGPADNSCCMARPEVSLYPNGSDACRNAAIYGLFSEKMDLGSFFYTDLDDGEDIQNMYLVLDIGSGSCPETHTSIAHAETATVGNSWLARAFFRVGALFGTGVVQAQSSGDCAVEITSVSQSLEESGDYKVLFHYDTVLEALSDYTIYVVGDDLSDTDVDKEGALSFYGVEMESDHVDFTTYDELCLMDVVEVTDSDEDSPGVYTQVSEDHDYTAAGFSYQTGIKQQIEPISSVYDWTWSTWSSDDAGEEILAQQSESSSTDGTADSNYAAAGENGEVNITATATITVDVQSETEGESHSGTTSATAMVCENPWPAITDFPFIDDSTGTGNGARAGIGWMNFSTYYCMDSGAETEDDDLPEVDVVLTEDTETDDVIKEYFFRLLADGESTGDAIGIRIASNSEYLSPMAWYTEQGFAGSPSEIAVAGGYKAVQDGRTTYVSFPNRTSSVLYSDMFVISYNSGASSETVEVYNQLISNLEFNTNFDDTALCMDSGGSYTDDTCVSDQDCDWANSERCDDQAAKVMRDMTRLTDLTDLAAMIEDYGDVNGYCSDTTSQTCTSDSQCPDSEECVPATPQLESGTFVASLSSSAWSSWNEQLRSELGEEPPSDPLNAYVNCGEDGHYTDYDADTCVNQTNGEYLCPNRETNVYHYRAYGKGGYYMGAELEFHGTPWTEDLDQDTSDSYNFQVYAKTGSGDGFASPSYFCANTRWGDETICGDGVIGGTEICEIGQEMDAATCDSDASVDSDGDGDATNDIDGSISQTCASDCLGGEDLDGATCEAFECGNGVIDTGETCDDGSYNGRYGFCDNDCTYASTFSCGDGSLAGGELCDCGSSSVSGLNYGGSACTDLNSTYNSNPNSSCAWDCSGAASFCGDGEVDDGEGEVCDGNSDSWDGELCVGGTDEGAACEDDADCDSAVCGDSSSSWSEACEITTVCLAGTESLIGYPCTSNSYCGTDDGVCSTSTFPTTRTITCADDGEGGETCGWNSPWSTTAFWQGVSCVASSDCGDGVVDDGEECDDGNDDSTDDCTTECQLNVCGDGYLYDGEEQCDEGSDNGVVCDSQYDSTCSYCNDSCVQVTYSGAFCGDTIIEDEEVCDGTDLPYWYAQLDGSLYPEGNVYGMCDREDEGAVIVGPDSLAYYGCSNVGVCNGGDNNGLMCLNDSGCEDDDGDGECILPSCADGCESTCPFTYENDQLLMKTNELGARRSNEIEMISYDADVSGTLLTYGNSATVYFPACTVATRLTADVDYEFDIPDTKIIFSTDMSGSMAYVWDGTCADDGTSCHYDSTCEEDESVECEGETRMDTTIDSLQTSVDGIFEGLGSGVEIGFIGFTNYMEDSDCDPDTETCGAVEEVEYTYASNVDDGFFYDADNSVYAQSEVASYIARSGTYTYYGLKAAQTAFTTYSSTDDRQIVVLMTDGLWSCESCGASQIDPALMACQLKDDGVEIYTVALYSGSDSEVSPVEDAFCDDYRTEDGWMDEEEWMDSLCGNGVVDDVADEQCDDGNDVDEDDCTNECTSPVCGDGVINGEEECDSGGTETADCNYDEEADEDDHPATDCQESECGDEYTNTADGETCDGDTGSDISSCSSSCVISWECCSGYYGVSTYDCYAEGGVADITTCGGCDATCNPGSGSGTSSCNNDGSCDVGETYADCPFDCPAETLYSPWISPVRISWNIKEWKVMSIAESVADFALELVEIPVARAATSETCAADYVDLDLIDQMACWSSGNPNDDNDVDYAHNGSSADELEEIYEEIVNSIVSIRFTYVIDGEAVSGNVTEGDDVEIPWPAGFACDGENSQEIPIRISFDDNDSGGTVSLDDMRFRYCEP